MTDKRILLVDDDSMIRMLIVHTLSGLSYEVSEAENGQEALDAMSTAKPDLVILDGMMPVMDGTETLRRMKADPSTRDVPVLMLTARRNEEATADALKLGAADYVSKPFKQEELVERIKGILN